MFFETPTWPNYRIYSVDESGLGTAVEIALGVALCTVCCFLVIVLVYIKRKKSTTDDLSVLAMTAVDSKSVQPQFATPTRMAPGSVAQPIATRGADDNYKYERIIEILKECDPDDWETYLTAFKNEKLTDAVCSICCCFSYFCFKHQWLILYLLRADFEVDPL